MFFCFLTLKAAAGSPLHIIHINNNYSCCFCAAFTFTHATFNMAFSYFDTDVLEMLSWGLFSHFSSVVFLQKSHGNGPLNRLLMAAKRKYMDTELPPQESEGKVVEALFSLFYMTHVYIIVYEPPDLNHHQDKTHEGLTCHSALCS